MIFANNMAFYLLAHIPILIFLELRSHRILARYKNRFADAHLFDMISPNLSKAKYNIRKVLLFAGLVFLILALSEPQFGITTEIIRETGTNIVVALDTSFSMLAEDILPNRFEHARFEINRLIEGLRGDQIALVSFAGIATVKCPLTTDYAAFKTVLEYQFPGIIPESGTNIERVINTSISMLRSSYLRGTNKLIILLTDGESLSGNALDAARNAASNGIIIYPVGIGTSSGSLIPIRNNEGKIIDYRKDSRGQIVRSALDETSLRRIAQITGGTYIDSSSKGTGIRMVSDIVGRVENEYDHERKVSRLKHRYRIPLGISLLCLTAWMFIGERHNKKRPEKVMTSK